MFGSMGPRSKRGLVPSPGFLLLAVLVATSARADNPGGCFKESDSCPCTSEEDGDVAISEFVKKGACEDGAENLEIEESSCGGGTILCCKTSIVEVSGQAGSGDYTVDTYEATTSHYQVGLALRSC